MAKAENSQTKQLHGRGAKHGKHGTKEYTAYQNARDRCLRKANNSYDRYGGRGIKFMFDSFVEFFDEVGLAPSPQHTLDRIDNTGNYEKGNLRWATHCEQQRNKRNNRLVASGGITMTAVGWEELLGLRKNIVAARFFYGRSDDALSSSKLRRKDSKTYVFKGVAMTVTELAKHTELSADSLRARLARGWSVEDSVLLPKQLNGETAKRARHMDGSRTT